MRARMLRVESNDRIRKGAAPASGSGDVSAVSNVLGASARVSGAVSRVSVACPVSALPGAQSALASSVSEGVSARLDKSPGASVGARRSVEEPKVAQGGGSAGSCAPVIGMRAPAVVVSSVVQGNSAPSESASVLGVSNIASGGSDKLCALELNC